MSKTVIRGGAQIVGSLPAGTGDNLLTTDGTSLGSISPIDTSTFVSKTLNSGEIIVGNGSNVATAVAMSGDGSISNAGVFAIGTGVIVNADVNASAGIALSKLAATTTSRLLVSDGSGFITPSAVTSTEAGYLSGVTSAIQTQLGTKVTNSFTASRALISNGSGNVAVSSVTSTELGYLSGVTSAIQTQLNTKLAASITGAAQGDIIYYNGSAWVNLAKGTTGQVLQSTAGSIQWASGASNGQPVGGTTGQYLKKQSATDYDSDWDDLILSEITDVSATAAEVNKLSGVTTTTTQLNFLNTTVGDVQSQLDSKLGLSLNQNYMFVGNASNVVSTLAPGTNGYVLTSVSGVPTWVSPGVGGTVTSVAASGGTTGMSFTGSPITTSGTLTLTGTLAIANGGTGLTALGTAGQLLKVNAGATALEFFTPTYLTSVGTGVANELTYWSGTNTLGSLATATYPSLTELSYVKGLTSAVQTQLNDKWALSGTNTIGALDVITGSNSFVMVDIAIPSQTRIFNFSPSNAALRHNTSVQLIGGDPLGTFKKIELQGAGITYTLGSDATGDIYYRNSSGYLTRLAAGTNGHVLTLASGIPSWAAPSGGGTWGSITGTLSSQTDLQTALDDKFSLTNGGTLSSASVLLDGGANIFTINNVSVFNLGANTSIDFDAPSFTFSNGPVSFEAGTTAYSSLKIPHGVAPTSPVDGDFWSTTAGFFGMVNGATVGPFGTGGGGLTVGTTTITSGTNGYGFYNNSGVLGEFAYGTGVRTFLTTPSWTNFQSAITGTSPYLPLTGATYTTTTGDGLALTTSTLTSGNLVSLTSTSTAAASNTNTLLNISSSGSNATSTQTVTGAKISVTNTGTSATNDALTVSSSGGTTNNAIKVSGGNILLTQAASQSILKSGGILTLGVSDFNTLALAVQNTNRITINGSSGAFTFTTNAASSGAITPYSFNDIARTNQTASTETNFVNWTPNTTQYATGAQTILRTYRMNPATYSFVGASTITDAYTLWVDDPVASTNATITNNWAAGFQGNVQITGNLGNTSSRVTKGWFTDLEVTNPIPGTIGGSTGLTDNAIPRANGTGGSTLQSSGVTIDDYDVITSSGFKQGSFSSGGTSYQTQQASLGSYGASSTGFIGLSNSSDYANNTVLYVEFTAVLMKSDGTASVSATVQSRFRKNNSGTWIADSAGTAVTSDATVMTTLVGDINGGAPGITWTSGAFAGTYAGGFSSKITAYIY